MARNLTCATYITRYLYTIFVLRFLLIIILFVHNLHDQGQNLWCVMRVMRGEDHYFVWVFKCVILLEELYLQCGNRSVVACSVSTLTHNNFVIHSSKITLHALDRVRYKPLAPKCKINISPFYLLVSASDLSRYQQGIFHCPITNSA